MGRNWIGMVLLCTMALSLYACGGSTEGNSNNDNGNGNGNDSEDNDDVADPDPETPQTSIRFGTFAADGTFEAERIGTSNMDLQAGDSATLTVSLVDDDLAGVPATTEIFYSSDCTADSLADISPSVIENGSGTVEATYTARGCDGEDIVRARTSIDGTTYTAETSLQTQPAELGAIQFQEASRNVIGLQGTGQIPEQATVTFLVTDQTGTPVSNQQVSFSVNTEVGGIELSRTEDTTNGDGLASTVVTSGTANTSVRVAATATQDNTTTTAQSSALSITTGIPDNDSFSISASILNIEGWDYDNTTTQINILAADRFNNPVPDDTAINFTTEGGSVVGSCLTENGGCSVEFRSQDPRPADGRVTVLATATGEESFTDRVQGDGRFQDAEFDPQNDLSEAFRDDDFDQVRDSGEPFTDAYNEGNFDGPNGTFEGLLCDNQSQSLCGPRDTVTVRDSIEIVLSGSSLLVDITPDNITLDEPTTITVTIEDSNNQVPPAGTTIEASTTVGEIVEPASITQASTNTPGPVAYEFRLEPSGQPGTGTFRVQVATPGPNPDDPSGGTISRDTLTVTEPDSP